MSLTIALKLGAKAHSYLTLPQGYGAAAQHGQTPPFVGRARLRPVPPCQESYSSE